MRNTSDRNKAFFVYTVTRYTLENKLANRKQEGATIRHRNDVEKSLAPLEENFASSITNTKQPRSSLFKDALCA